MNVVVVGSGYVGLVTAVGLSSVGHCVSVVDVDQSRIDAIASGVVPFHEPGLGALLRTGLDHGTIVPTTDLSSAMAGAKVVMIAVGTPPAASGRADLSAVFAAVESVARAATGPCTIVLKSTVPAAQMSGLDLALARLAPVGTKDPRAKGEDAAALRAERAIPYTMAGMAGKDAWLVTLEAPLAPGVYAWHTAKALDLRDPAALALVPRERLLAWGFAVE